MSTHAHIGLQHADGTVSSIYLHWDGHPDTCGATLLQHYATSGRVCALMALGNLSQLRAAVAPQPGQPHTFDAPADGVCVAYGRDRGEPSNECTRSTEVEFWADAVGPDGGAAYAYLYRLGIGWTVRANSWRRRGTELLLALVDLAEISQ